MGRYSSVQAVSDQQNTRTTTYEQEKASSSTVVTEKVHNPYGSIQTTSNMCKSINFESAQTKLAK